MRDHLPVVGALRALVPMEAAVISFVCLDCEVAGRGEPPYTCWMCGRPGEPIYRHPHWLLNPNSLEAVLSQMRRRRDVSSTAR